MFQKWEGNQKVGLALKIHFSNKKRIFHKYSTSLKKVRILNPYAKKIVFSNKK